MKRIVLILICALVMNMIHAADVNKSGAITPNLKLQEQGVKIGFVDPYKVIQSLDQWKDEGLKIQKDIQARNEAVEAKKAAYGTKMNALQSMGTTAKPEVVTAKGVELKQLEIEINAMAQSLQEYAERIAQEAQMVVFKEIERTTQEIALEKGLDLILAGGVLYVAEKLDISAVVIGRMNAKYAEKKKADQKATVQKTTAQ